MSVAHPAVPPYRRLLHSLNDPDEYGVAISGGRLVAEFLAPQEHPARVEQFQSAGWALDFHQVSVKARICGALPVEWASVGLMCSRAPSSWYGVANQGAVLACTPPGDVIDGHFSPGFECMSVTMPLSLWNQGRTIAGVEQDFGTGRVLSLSADCYARFARESRRVRRVLRDSENDPELRFHAERQASNLALEIVSTMWELADNQSLRRESLRNRVRLVRRAEAWMRAHLSEPIGVLDICQALRVSRRELEYAFRSVFDQSPREYLHLLRLNAVQKALRKSPGTTVLETALDHGVTHLGRFAADYRLLFGEYPSDTVCRG